MSRPNPFAYSTLNIGGRDALLNEKIRHAIQLRKTRPTFSNRSSFEDRPKTSGSGRKTKLPDNPDITYLLNGAVKHAVKHHKRKSINGEKDAFKSSQSIIRSPRHQSIYDADRNSLNTSEIDHTGELQFSQLNSSTLKDEAIVSGGGFDDSKGIAEDFENLNSITQVGSSEESLQVKTSPRRVHQNPQPTFTSPLSRYDSIRNTQQYSKLNAQTPGTQETEHMNVESDTLGNLESYWLSRKSNDENILEAVSGTRNNPFRLHSGHSNGQNAGIPNEKGKRAEHMLYLAEQKRKAALQPYTPSGPKSSFQRFIPREKRTSNLPNTKFTNSIALRLISKEMRREKISPRKPKRKQASLPSTAVTPRSSAPKNALQTNVHLSAKPMSARRAIEAPRINSSLFLNEDPPQVDFSEQIRIFIHLCIVRPPQLDAIPKFDRRLLSGFSPFEIDGIVITEEDNFEVLVISRNILNQATYHALPGAELHYHESPEDVAVRFIGTHLSNKIKPILPLHLITVAAKPDRDPIGHVIAHVYALKTEDLGNMKETLESGVETHSSFEFIPINILLQSEDYILALDHRNLLLQFLLWFRAYGRSLLF